MKVKTLSKNNVTHCRCVFSALRPEGAKGLSPGVLTPGRASQRREIALKERQIKSNVTDRAEGFIPRFKDTRSLPSAALISERGRILTFKTQGSASLTLG